jgi:FAD/FMN-containing dehydrogenase
VTDTTTTSVIEPEVLDALDAGLRGKLIRPHDADYDSARTVWNGAIDKRPGAVVRCAGIADVLHAVNVARSAGLVIAVRAGGHSFAGFGVCDGGVVIDLGAMTGVRVEPHRRRARCEPGVLWGQLDHETQAFALATPGGVVSHTGVAGLTLGGGMGWLTRKHGLSCDNLMSADVVTADGHLVCASEDECPDLFWGLRGGGGNFGVVTSFEFALHHVGPAVLAGMAFFPVARANEVGAFAHEWASTAPRELSTIFGVVTAPPEPFIAPDAQGQPAVVVQFCWTGPIEKGERVIAPLRALSPAVGEMVATMPYAAWQSAQDPAWSHGTRVYLKSGFVHTLTGDTADAMVEQVLRRASPLSGIFMHQVGGAVRDVDADATAYAHRAPDWNINIAGVWDDDNGTPEGESAWARQSWDTLLTHMTGELYSNFIGAEPDADHADLVERAYRGRYDRLAALKRKYDPTNLFRLNANVQPA